MEFSTINYLTLGCHMATGNPNDFIYCEANWVASDPNQIIFQGPLVSSATKCDIILNGLYFNTAWR